MYVPLDHRLLGFLYRQASPQVLLLFCQAQDYLLLLTQEWEMSWFNLQVSSTYTPLNSP
jgi:hypothetical protein